MTEIKERQHFLDVLRSMAACAVVLLHTVTGVMDTTDMSQYLLEKKVFLVVMDLVCWSVPVFLLISGYLFLDPGREIPIGRMMTKYCRRILLALFVFGVPYAWLELVMTEGRFRFGMMGEGILMVLQGRSWAHMWYLYLLFFLYLLTPALKLLLKKLPIPAVYAIVVVLFLGCSIMPFLKSLFNLPSVFLALPGDGIYLFYYIYGYLFAVRYHEGRKLPSFFPAMAAALALVMAGSRIGGFNLRMAYNYPFTVLLSLSLFGAGVARQQRRPHRNTAFWEATSALSFGVYLIHPVFLNIFYKLLGITPLSFSIWLSLPAFFLSTLLLASVSAWLLRTLPPLRKYVL